MADLRVDTDELRGAAARLRSVARIVADERSGRVEALVPALGLDGPVAAAEGFWHRWGYGVKCLGSQAEHVGRELLSSAAAYEAAEASLTRAAGGAARMPIGAQWGPIAEPVRMHPVWRPSTAMTGWVQLAQARRVEELIPGEPDQSATLGRRLIEFADTAGDALSELGRIGLGAWAGPTAQVVMGELDHLRKRLVAADNAFAAAGDAVSKYAQVHASTRDRAATALTLWRSAAPASAAAHGAFVTVAPVAGPPDPDGTLARAGAMLAEAREDLERAARALVAELEEAGHGAPNEPGLFAGIRRFFEGVGEGVAELITAPVALVALAVRLDPARVLWDPHGYAASMDTFYSGIANIAARHKMEFVAQVLDVETFKSDPARWAGKLAPDLALLLGGAVLEGTDRAAETTERITSAAEKLENLTPEERLATDLNRGLLDRRVTELGLDPNSAAGRGALKQLRAPGATVDHWVPIKLHRGDVIAVSRDGTTITPVTGPLTTNGAEFYGELQVAPVRLPGPDGVPTAPQVPGQVYLFQVDIDEMDAAGAHAISNPQFGHGGGSLYSLSDPKEAVRTGQLKGIGEHTFDPGTLRSKFEDPRYREIDPSLPVRALDPDHERLVGEMDKAREHVRDHFRDAATTAVTERGEKTDPARISEGAR